MKENRQLFFRDHLIYEMYQQILIELVRLFRHLLKLKVKGNHSIQNIFILGGAVIVIVLEYRQVATQIDEGWNYW
ncbi:hypothetical protein LOK49_LG11G01484 [Camellia lanceoleosa]|uniref:Uncharacterized protein n=1 Tax=Camellia lanceoleosa TaxID=1840588 RepID=A0ACC0G2L0_9ERIC|nr:hypothetical protein LOK49_LG11G01484 [Camellia lanceoleosa]